MTAGRLKSRGKVKLKQTNIQLQTEKPFERKYRILWKCIAKRYLLELEASVKGSLKKYY